MAAEALAGWLQEATREARNVQRSPIPVQKRWGTSPRLGPRQCNNNNPTEILQANSGVSQGSRIGGEISVPATVRELPDSDTRKQTMKTLFIISVVIATMAWSSAQAADAKATYGKKCASCHGADGKGETKMGKKLAVKDYTDAKVQQAMKDDAAFKSIKEGMKDKGGKTLMKPLEGVTDDEIKALVKMMREFKK